MYTVMTVCTGNICRSPMAEIILRTEFGPAGPSGPDTEIFFDRGEDFDPDNIGIRLLEEDIENDRYIEIWNIALSQFNPGIGLFHVQNTKKFLIKTLIRAQILNVL